ncbi:MAG: MCE family protein [Pseudonocardia sp.]
MPTSNSSRWFQIAAIVAVVAVVASLLVAYALSGTSRTVTAYFTSAEGVFPSNSVRVLGVPVGTITGVEPQGTTVKVDIEITDDDLQLPTDVRAVVVSPSVVTGRYVQFTPTYAGGPELADGAVIPVERTAVPLGVDDLARTATELATALGPQGVNADGALSDVLDVGAANLGGNGEAFNDAVRNFGELSGTLSGSREELFGTVTELQSFVSTIRANDAEVREFNRRLEEVSGFLADDREDLGAAFRELSIALGDVAAFVRDNREILDSNVERLVNVTDAVVRQRDALTEILDVAPLGLGNLGNAYNSTPGTLDTRVNMGGDGPDTGGLTALLCQIASPQFPTAPLIGQICAMVAAGGMGASSPEAITALRVSIAEQAGVPLDQIPGLVVPTDEPGAIPDVTTLPGVTTPPGPTAPAPGGAPASPAPDSAAPAAPAPRPASGPAAEDPAGLLGPAVPIAPFPPGSTPAPAGGGR